MLTKEQIKDAILLENLKRIRMKGPNAEKYVARLVKLADESAEKAYAALVKAQPPK